MLLYHHLKSLNFWLSRPTFTFCPGPVNYVAGSTLGPYRRLSSLPWQHLQSSPLLPKLLPHGDSLRQQCDSRDHQGTTQRERQVTREEGYAERGGTCHSEGQETWEMSMALPTRVKARLRRPYSWSTSKTLHSREKSSQPSPYQSHPPGIEKFSRISPEHKCV